MSALVTISECPVFWAMVEALPFAAQLPDGPGAEEPPQAAAAALPITSVRNSFRVRSIVSLRSIHHPAIRRSSRGFGYVAHTATILARIESNSLGYHRI